MSKKLISVPHETPFPAELIVRACEPHAPVLPTRTTIGIDLGARHGYASYVLMTHDVQGVLTVLDSGRASTKKPFCTLCRTEVMEVCSARDERTGDYVVTVICHGRQETTRISERDMRECKGELTYTECFRHAT